MTTIEKLLTCLGLIGFGILCPQLLFIFGVEGPQLMLEQYLGALANPSILSLAGFSFILVAVFFGGGDAIGVTLLGIFTAFLLVSTSVEVGFMMWLKNLMAKTAYTSNFHLNYIVGLSTLLIGLVFSFFPRVSFKALFAILVVVPILFIGVTQHMGMFQFQKEFDISVNEGLSTLIGMIDQKYQEMPQVKEFIDDVEEDEELSPEQKQKKLEELQESITKLEDDQSALKRLKEENAKFKELIAKQQEELDKVGWCSSSRDSDVKTKTFDEAVRPNQPCVRDFAVSIVKEFPGSFNGSARGIPGPAGIEQICALNMHLFSNWDYISDPIVLRDDFYSQADRTIAIGLAGDCDDFAVLDGLLRRSHWRKSTHYGWCLFWWWPRLG